MVTPHPDGHPAQQLASGRGVSEQCFQQLSGTAATFCEPTHCASYDAGSVRPLSLLSLADFAETVWKPVDPAAWHPV